MRKFTLYNYDETASFSLFDKSIIVTDVDGLGTNLNLTKSEGADRFYISDVYADYDDINMKIYFGVNGNAYNDYNALMSFISNNGKNKLVLEYDVLGNKKYCDVWLQKAPKTQKDTTNTMNYTFTFKRLSHWYTKISISFSLQTTFREVDFPLDIPITFVGALNVSDVEINNTFFDDYYVDVTITGPLTHDLEIYLKDAFGKVVQKIIVQKVLSANDIFYINSETKKIIYYNGFSVITENAYNDIDHNYDSFITVPTGKHSIGVSLQSGDTCLVTITYRKSVLD